MALEIASAVAPVDQTPDLPDGLRIIALRGRVATSCSTKYFGFPGKSDELTLSCFGKTYLATSCLSVADEFHDQAMKRKAPFKMDIRYHHGQNRTIFTMCGLSKDPAFEPVLAQREALIAQTGGDPFYVIKARLGLDRNGNVFLHWGDMLGGYSPNVAFILNGPDWTLESERTLRQQGRLAAEDEPFKVPRY